MTRLFSARDYVLLGKYSKATSGIYTGSMTMVLKGGRRAIAARNVGGSRTGAGCTGGWNVYTIGVIN